METRMLLEKRIGEQDKKISDLTVNNEYVDKKNMSLDKELKRIKLAFNESQRGKLELNKELVNQRETLADALKENTVLTEEVRIKAKFIQLMKEQFDTKEGNNNQEVNKDQVDNDQDVIEIEEANAEVDDTVRSDEIASASKPVTQEKGKECDYQPNIPKH